MYNDKPLYLNIKKNSCILSNIPFGILQKKGLKIPREVIRSVYLIYQGRLLITSLGILDYTASDYPTWYLIYTASDYLPWYLSYTASDYPLGILDIRLLITSGVIRSRITKIPREVIRSRISKIPRG
jgi:hypothetical protein